MFKSIIEIVSNPRTGWPRNRAINELAETKSQVLQLRTGDTFELQSGVGGHGMLYVLAKIEQSYIVIQPQSEAKIREADGKEIDLKQDTNARILQVGQTVIIRSGTTDIVDEWGITLQQIVPNT